MNNPAEFYGVARNSGLFAGVCLNGAWRGPDSLPGTLMHSATENLHQQLGEIQDRETGVKMRLDELEYDLKPENIERFFNGYGSTRPEELRDRRRKQLQFEKDRLLGQQQELATRRSSLESAISVAQVQVYQQNAPGPLRYSQEDGSATCLVLPGDDDGNRVNAGPRVSRCSNFKGADATSDLFIRQRF
jgi:hypothetical protein